MVGINKVLVTKRAFKEKVIPTNLENPKVDHMVTVGVVGELLTFVG